jgi:hypothetical protein
MEEYLHCYYIVYSTLLFAQLRCLDFALVLRGVRIAYYVGFCKIFCWHMCSVFVLVISAFVRLRFTAINNPFVVLKAFLIHESEWYAWSF